MMSVCLSVCLSVSLPVYLSVFCQSVCPCVSVESHLTSVLSDNTVMLSAGNGGPKICGIFSAAASLQRSSTHSYEGHMVGHFPAESAHAHYSVHHMVAN